MLPSNVDQRVLPDASTRKREHHLNRRRTSLLTSSDPAPGLSPTGIYRSHPVSPSSDSTPPDAHHRSALSAQVGSLDAESARFLQNHRNRRQAHPKPSRHCAQTAGVQDRGSGTLHPPRQDSRPILYPVHDQPAQPQESASDAYEQSRRWPGLTPESSHPDDANPTSAQFEPCRVRTLSASLTSKVQATYVTDPGTNTRARAPWHSESFQGFHSPYKPIPWEWADELSTSVTR